MSQLVAIITADSPAVRHRSLDAFCRAATLAALLAEAQALDRFRRDTSNLYHRVRAHFFLCSIHRFHLALHPDLPDGRPVPLPALQQILRRRFNEAIDILLPLDPARTNSSALAAAYHGLAFQTLAAQVRKSVRAVRGNQWMSRTGHPADYPLKVGRALACPVEGVYPVLREATPVRMDLTHSAWSDIFFLGMDYPEGARVLNISVDLAVRAQSKPSKDEAERSKDEAERSTEGADDNPLPQPPVEAYFRVIEEPVLRLTSVDLAAAADITTLAEVFDFARDHLGLLKAGVIAAGLIPPGMEGAQQPLADLLARLTGTPGHGIELVSRVNGIPKGSRLAVSTTLLACIITVCMRATGQIRALTGGLSENERRLVAARAILGEWLGGSGGGWQDSGGIWPGMKTIQGVAAVEGDPEFGVSRGRLLPRHQILTDDDVSAATRERLQNSLVLVHGGMAQDVGPVLEMVTEKYLLRSEAEWQGREQAIRTFDDLLGFLRSGDIRSIGRATESNFFGPIQTIIPWASNLYTETLIRTVRDEFRDDFYGFWMLGGMAGGGMGFLFNPLVRTRAQHRLQVIMSEAKRRLEHAVPFAIEPVVYDFAINERGSWAQLLTGNRALMPPAYYTQALPSLLKTDLRLLPETRRAELEYFGAACRTSPHMAGTVQNMFDVLLPRRADEVHQTRTLDETLEQLGFDRVQHEQIRTDLRHGRIGLSQNRLPPNTDVRDVEAADVWQANAEHEEEGRQALRDGRIAVVTLAAGLGTRWTHGAGVVKALNPFAKFAGQHRNFIEVHLAKTRRTVALSGIPLPHVITTSYLTHQAIASWLATTSHQAILSPGRAVGLRLIPMTRDLQFAWDETPRQLLDERKQRQLDGSHAALMTWARQAGEGADYTANLPQQCLHPTGHWYEIPNMLRNGVLAQLLQRRPNMQYLMLHNIDTLGAHVDPRLLGWFLKQNAAMMFEIIPRLFDDRGGGLARVNGQPRLVEGLALPSEEVEAGLSYYNSATAWIDIDRLLGAFALTRSDLQNEEKIASQVRRLAARMPTYITLKDVKKRWGKGQEDIYPVAQFEKLWGDMTALPDLPCRFAVVDRRRGQQLKEPAQLDAWLRDGSAAYIEGLCQFLQS